MSNPVFLKVRSGNLFWSARVCNLVRKTKTSDHLLKNTIINNNKNCQKFQAKIQFYGLQNYFKRFCGPQKNVFCLLWSTNFKSLGNTGLTSSTLNVTSSHKMYEMKCKKPEHWILSPLAALSFLTFMWCHRNV